MPLNNFTILIAYMSQLRGPLQSMLTSVSKFLDLAVNFERLSSMLKENKRTVELDSA